MQQKQFKKHTSQSVVACYLAVLLMSLMMLDTQTVLADEPNMMSTTGSMSANTDKSNPNKSNLDNPNTPNTDNNHSLSPKEQIQVRNILLHQRHNGGWPKGYNRNAELNDEQIRNIQQDKNKQDTNFDNGTTYTELRKLAIFNQKHPNPIYQDAFVAGIEYILSAQYPNGGWPQYYPYKIGRYNAHITFNDDAMIGVLYLLDDISRGYKQFRFVPENLKQRCQQAVDIGIQCILDCQIIQDGQRTVWCAQHDAQTLAPASARSYELASLSGKESVRIVQFLMRIPQPSPEIHQAIQGAVAWFKQTKITGKRVKQVSAPDLYRGYDRFLVDDPNAKPLWARFYHLGSNKPLFCNRDGIPVDRYDQIAHERRVSYNWLGNYAQRLLEKDYPKWQARFMDL